MSTSVSRPCLVLIAPSEHLAALRKYAPPEPGELLTFSDTEPLQALEAITTRRPSVVALERMFAATPRGSALIGRIRADPTLAHAEIMVVAHDDEQALETLRRGGASAPPTTTPPVPAAPIDFRGTRRAPRIRMAEHLKVMVDGHAATLVDLSIAGAQVVSTAVLRPNHRVRVVMADDRSSVRCVGLVAWASFEIPPRSAPLYRAGLQFLDANPVDVEAYCDRHREHPRIED
jgi:hypothetical protein